MPKELVKPWRKVPDPTGPISPLQKKPPSGMSPTFPRKRPVSWSGLPKRCWPRPRQEKRSAPEPGASWWGRRVGAEHGVEVLGGAHRVADVELDDLALAEHLADGKAVALALDAHDVANEEVALDEVRLQGIHHHAKVEGGVDEAAVAFVGALELAAEHLHGLLFVELEQDVALRLGDDVGAADGAAPLRDDGFDPDVAGQRDADGPAAVDVIVQKRALRPGPCPPLASPPILTADGKA